MGTVEYMFAIVVLQALMKWLEAKNKAGADHPEDNDFFNAIIKGLVDILQNKK